ncbi:glycosyltransferase [Pediococcus ethanolidurans]|uniref:glycosyltransferase n=1 Tax=Pediococcus ethanolidurans TaxID=319653 RepID=UPI002955D1BE|nr:glycosyltransferase [Pediococcus ethanolidurans]
MTFNRKLLLAEAVQSILQQTLLPQKIVIIDNHSTDGTFEYIKKRFMINNNCIDYIRLDENVGGSAGFYKGIQEALNYNAEWIGISDDDAIYQPDFFEKIFQVVNQNAEIKAFTGSVYLPNGKIQTSHRHRVIDSDTLKQKEVDKEEYQANFLLDVFTFVGVVLSTKLIKKIGLPEKDYFILV